jgi:ankyrin repeat protein
MDAVERERNALVAMSTSGSRSDLASGDAAYVDNKTKKASREEDLREAMAAARRGDATVMDALITAKRVKALPLPGLEAARRGDLDLLRTLVSRDGWDPRTKDAVDRHGSNALLWAAGAGHVDCVAFLVERCGMNPQTAVQSGRRSYAGRSALHWAARNGHADVVEYLLTRGVDPNSTTADGSTAFAWACWQGHLTVMRQLVERAGCDYESRNDYGCNVACWTAMGAGGVECCDYLASLGVPFDLINANGHSCLHKAAQRGNRDVCEWLLSRPNLGLTRAHARPDAEGYDPAGLALVEGFTDVAHWLTARQRALPPAPLTPS